MEDFDGNQRYAEYKNFKVASEKVLITNDSVLDLMKYLI